jgi:hypothetical protein
MSGKQSQPISALLESQQMVSADIECCGKSCKYFPGRTPISALESIIDQTCSQNLVDAFKESEKSLEFTGDAEHNLLFKIWKQYKAEFALPKEPHALDLPNTSDILDSPNLPNTTLNSLNLPNNKYDEWFHTLLEPDIDDSANLNCSEFLPVTACTLHDKIENSRSQSKLSTLTTFIAPEIRPALVTGNVTELGVVSRPIVALPSASVPTNTGTGRKRKFTAILSSTNFIHNKNHEVALKKEQLALKEARKRARDSHRKNEVKKDKFLHKKAHRHTVTPHPDWTSSDEDYKPPGRH